MQQFLSARPDADLNCLQQRMNQFAQELNNSAASCIEIGLYSRAISSLKRALKLYKHQEKLAGEITNTVLCKCMDCTLDGCVCRSGSQHLPSTSTTRTTPTTPHLNGETTRKDNNLSSSSSCYTNISQQPIRVRCQGHTIGPALSLIIVYNIALANHLIAVYTTNNTSGERKIYVSSALAIYRFIYEKLLAEDKNKSEFELHRPVLASLQSVRFEMIILNNICEMYSLNDDNLLLVGNSTNNHDSGGKQQHYRRRLWSIMMVVVDHNLMATNDTDGNSNTERMWRIQLDNFIKNAITMISESERNAGAA